MPGSAIVSGGATPLAEAGVARTVVTFVAGSWRRQAELLAAAAA